MMDISRIDVRRRHRLASAEPRHRRTPSTFPRAGRRLHLLGLVSRRRRPQLASSTSSRSSTPAATAGSPMRVHALSSTGRDTPPSSARKYPSASTPTSGAGLHRHAWRAASTRWTATSAGERVARAYAAVVRARRSCFATWRAAPRPAAYAASGRTDRSSLGAAGAEATTRAWPTDGTRRSSFSFRPGPARARSTPRPSTAKDFHLLRPRRGALLRPLRLHDLVTTFRPSRCRSLLLKEGHGTRPLYRSSDGAAGLGRFRCAWRPSSTRTSPHAFSGGRGAPTLQRGALAQSPARRDDRHLRQEKPEMSAPEVTRRHRRGHPPAGRLRLRCWSTTPTPTMVGHTGALNATRSPRWETVATRGAVRRGSPARCSDAGRRG